MHKSYLVVSRPRTKPLLSGGGEWAFDVEYKNIVLLKDARRLASEVRGRFPNDEVQIWQDTTKTKVVEKYSATKNS